MKKKRNSINKDEWLNTYADMITLVLTFFVLLYSISNVNLTKLEQISQAMQKKLGIESKVELEDVNQELKYPQIQDSNQISHSSSQQALADMENSIETYATQNQLDTKLALEENVLYIRFNNDLLFGPDSAQIQPSSYDFLNYLGDVMKTSEGEIMAIYINGHTASGTSSKINDRLLSSERADNVAIYLEEQKGIEPKKLISRGYGKNYPVADNSTKEGREQNRRVDIIILGNDFNWSGVTDGGNGTAQTFDPLTPIEVPDSLTQ